MIEKWKFIIRCKYHHFFGKKDIESWQRFFLSIPKINRGGCYIAALVLQKHFGGEIIYALSNRDYNAYKSRKKQYRATGSGHVYLRQGHNYIDSRGKYTRHQVINNPDGYRILIPIKSQPYIKTIAKPINFDLWNSEFPHWKKQILIDTFL